MTNPKREASGGKAPEQEEVRAIVAYLDKNLMTSGELAKKINAHEATVDRWITGKARISNVYIKLLQRAGVLAPGRDT